MGNVVGNDRVGDGDISVEGMVCSGKLCISGGPSCCRLRSSMAVCRGSAQAESDVAFTGSAVSDGLVSLLSRDLES